MNDFIFFDIVCFNRTFTCKLRAKNKSPYDSPIANSKVEKNMTVRPNIIGRS